MINDLMTFHFQKATGVVLNVERAVYGTRWVEPLSVLVLRGGWENTSADKLQQMRNIAEIDSQMMFEFVSTYPKKLGIDGIEKISTLADSENEIFECLEIVMKKGIYNGAKEIDLILSRKDSTKTLFDFDE